MANIGRKFTFSVVRGRKQSGCCGVKLVDVNSFRQIFVLGSMKRTILAVILLISSITLLQGADSTVYERTRARLQQVLEQPDAYGAVKVSTQLRRWEWFWQGRLMEDGSFPSPRLYQQEHSRVQSQKSSDNVQALKVWKELGPTAPNSQPGSSGWGGIGRVNIVEFSRQNANLMYCGTAAGGMWKSTNGGTSWTYVDITIIPVIGISDIAVSPLDDKIIYVATGDVDGAQPGDFTGYPSFSYGVVKSTDGGVTWAMTGLVFDPTQNTLVSRLRIDPRNSNIVLAATYSGIMRTTDGGATWKKNAVGLFRDLIGNPTNLDVIYASTYAEQGGAKIYRSTDGGVVWEERYSLPNANRIRLAVTKANPNVVGAVASVAFDQGLEGVYKSSDAAATFANLPTELNLLNWNTDGSRTGSTGNKGQGFYDLAMEFSPTNANHFFVGGISIWRTTTNGQSWIPSANWHGEGSPYVHSDHHSFKFHPTQNRLFSAHDGGIARSTDQGVSWLDISSGLRIQQYYGLSTSNINPSVTLMGSQDNGTAITKNNGSTFAQVLGSDGMLSAIDALDPQTMYASQYYGQFYRSSNQGNNWIFSTNAGNRSESLAAWAAPIVADPLNQNVAYCGYGQVYKSTTSGATWNRISQISTSVPLRLIAVAPSNPAYIYVAYNTTLWFTSNGGTTWQQQTGLSGVIMSIEVNPLDPKKYYVSLGGYSSGQKVLHVSNGVVTNITGKGLPNVPCNSLAFQNGTTKRIFAGTDLGVFFNDEGTDSWLQYGSGLPPVAVSGMRVVKTSNLLRVSTYGRGIWEIDIQQCTASQPSVKALTPTTKCAGDSVILEASTGFSSYRWSNGDTTRRIVLKSIAQTGTYTVSVEDNNGCRALSTATVVTLLQAPSRPSISLRGSDTLRSTAFGGITVFQWLQNGSEIPGATSRDFFTRTSGQYSVRVENAMQCRSTSNEFTFVYNPTSVEEDVAAGRVVGIHPNPTSDLAVVSMPSITGRTLEVMSMTGQIIFASTVEDDAEEYQLRLSGYAVGVYIVRIKSGASVWMVRLVRE